MTSFALASEYPRLSASQKNLVTHIIADDGEWTEAEIQSYIAKNFAEDIVEERKEGWGNDHIV